MAPTQSTCPWDQNSDWTSLRSMSLQTIEPRPRKRSGTGGTVPIDGTSPRTLHPKLNKPDSHGVSDIVGASPRSSCSLRVTRRCVNPLDPTYVLPTSAPSIDERDSVAPTRRLRDPNDISDIEGTRTSEKRWAVRDSHSVHDIDGAHPSWKPTFRQRCDDGTRVSSLYTADICAPSFTTSRRTDPLAPVYRVHGEVIKDADAVARSLVRPDAQRDFALKTSDVPGARPNASLGSSFRHLTSRKDFRETNCTRDIRGSAADSVRRGIRVSGRRTNPLSPDYVYLDGGNDPDSEATRVAMESACVEAAANEVMALRRRLQSAENELERITPRKPQSKSPSRARPNRRTLRAEGRFAGDPVAEDIQAVADLPQLQ